jgi:hypothetical protein
MRRTCLAAYLLLACGDPPQPISPDVPAAVQADLDRWGQGRWEWVSVTRDAEDRRLVVDVEIPAEADGAARDEYCRVIGETVRPRLQAGQWWEAALRVQGRAVRECS